ncbi:MAG TPA: D-2-hydroxyacid dehydrogenase [Xanthobacteraceae bacterium]|nr:D-2-hydroxyacid dehydrogenase [Xanthobacteraceae bacterium]
MTCKVLIYAEQAEEYFARLKPQFPEVEFFPAYSRAAALPVIADVEAIFTLAHVIPRDLLAQARSLKWLQSMTTGTDALIGVLPSHILLTSCRGAHGPQMSELAFLYMLALNRNFLRMMKAQAEARWDRYAQPVLEGKTVVIVGVGYLAEHLAARCKLFGMRVLGVTTEPRKLPDFDHILPRTALREAAAQADFLVLLVPYSQETHHLVDGAVLAAMKPTAFLINLARGGVLDEAAFVAHMRAGRIAGAALDVFNKQPLPPDSPLWHLPNVIITPNIGGHSDRFVEQTLAIAIPNLRAFLDGRIGDMQNVVPH